MRQLLGQTVTVIHFGPGPRDRQGNPTRVETGRDTYQARLRQEDTTELAAGRDALIDLWRIYLPARTVIDPDDRVDVGERIFTVQGSPARILDGRGLEHHVEARLRYVGSANA